MLANNEIGTIQPIQELCELTHKHGALFHTDAVQAVGHISIDVKKFRVDMLSASAHKFNGPKGIGFMYIKKGTPIAPLISGGSQESGLRSGTENVAAIVGMAVALKHNVDRIPENARYLKQLEKKLLRELTNCQIDYVRNGENHLPGNLSLSFKGANGETLLHRLDLMGITVSTGSACDSINNQVSHVLRAISLDDEYAEGTIRISLSSSNTIEEVQTIAKVIVKILGK
jgi:cysteine desulfurase